MDRAEFIRECGRLLTIAKPHLVQTEYEMGHEILNRKNGKVRVFPDAEYAVVTCANGCEYYIDITADSLAAIVIDIFTKMTHK